MTKAAHPAPSHLLTVSKIKSIGHLYAAAEHNLRDYPDGQDFPANVDRSRSRMNEILRGPAIAKEVMDLERQLLNESEAHRKNNNGTTRKTRTDAVRAIEVMASVTADFAFDDVRYFRDVVDFIEDRFGAPVISAVIHRDEGKPHLHCLIVPLKHGRLVGSEMVGSYDKLQAAFFDKVASRYGFVPKVRLHPATSTAIADSAMHAIDLNPELLLAPGFQEWLYAALKRDAVPVAALFGLHLPRAQKGWVATMTRPTGPARRKKGDTAHREQAEDPVAHPTSAKITLSCDKVISPASQQNSAGHAAAACVPKRGKPHLTLVPSRAVHADRDTATAGAEATDTGGASSKPDYVVEREGDMPADWWDSQTGEFVPPRSGGS